jgi:Zn-dependent protease
MIELLFQGQYALFVIVLIAIIISLTFHEFGHAVTAKWYGDDTAQLAGRLTLNPMAHIDPMGLLMVATIGFGYAKPVPTNPSKFNSFWADLFVSAAGPAMNALIAILSINFYFFGLAQGWEFLYGDGPRFFFVFLTLINLILMLFNLLPIGALDGHYILPYFLPRKLAHSSRYWNARYGNFLLLGLVLLSIMGLPIFSTIWRFGESMLPAITFIN